jgi:hypothetical protein
MQLRGLLLVGEAKTSVDYKNALARYMVGRYGEHAADEAISLLQRSRPQDFQKQLALKYMDSRLDGIVKDLVKSMTPTTNAPKSKDEPEAGFKAADDDEESDDGPAFKTPDEVAAQRAKTTATAASRPDRAGTTSNVQRPAGGGTRAEPGKATASVMGTAGQYQIKKPSADPSIKPTVKAKPGESGMSNSQKKVDYVTQTYGQATGDRLAKKLGVPTSAERGGVLGVGMGSPWKTKPKVVSGQAAQKAADPDSPTAAPTPRNARDIPPRPVAQRPGGSNGKPLVRTRNPETGEDEVGVRPGDFVGQRWKPHGISKKVATARPDAATGNFQRGSRLTNPSQEGQEMVWDGSDWVLPSVYAASRAQAKASN